METTIVTNNNGNAQAGNYSQFSNQQTITSMEIAEVTGKNHSDVLRAIRKMEPAWEKEHKSKFALKLRLVETGCGAHKKSPYYEMNRTECLFVATKFNDQARARLVIRWAELEEERMKQQAAAHQSSDNLPADPSQLTRKQLLLMALEAEEERERLKAEKEELEADKIELQNENKELEAKTVSLMIEQGQKDEKINELQKRVSYLDLIDRSTDTLNTTQIAKDYGYSAVAFNQLLKGLRIQYNSGGQWVLYTPYSERGYVANRQIEICHVGRPSTYKQMTVWTPLGRHWLYEVLKKRGILPLVERMQAQPAPGTANGKSISPHATTR